MDDILEQISTAWTDVPVEGIAVSTSPRLGGESDDHVRALAESETLLPPIIVHRETMQIIDGAHRLRAVQIRGDTKIRVRFFEGSESDAFVLAVQANIMHGLPLSTDDRTAAAMRILTTHPHWSDRTVASKVGLAHKTIGVLRRRCLSGEQNQLDARVGRDGRVRPLDQAARRSRAEDFIKRNPEASLRTVASAAGISPETARSVRNQIRHNGSPQVFHEKEVRYQSQAGSRKTRHTAASEVFDQRRIVRQLSNDPAIRFTESGRALLRILDANTVDPDSWQKLVKNVPEHWLSTLAKLARQHAETWRGFSEWITSLAQRQGDVETPDAVRADMR